MIKKSQGLTALLAVVLSLAAPGVRGAEAERKQARDTELKKKGEFTPDKALAGDVSRKREAAVSTGPSLNFEQFRQDIELQVAGKRREQIANLEQIIELSQDRKEKPSLLFRLGELFWEESRYLLFEANRRDDERAQAMAAQDRAALEAAEAEQKRLYAQRKDLARKAIEQYTKIVQEYKDFERTDEVLYYLGLNLMEMGDDKKALLAYRRLLEKYEKSRFVPDAWLAVGEYYFAASRAKRDMLEKALTAYKNAAKYPDSAVYSYALYKQGWCYYNLTDFARAMDQFKAVVLYADLVGEKEAEGGAPRGAPSKGGRTGLVSEARKDFVLAYGKGGGLPREAKDTFTPLAKTPDDLRLMSKQLANLYYGDGKDREAAVMFDTLIRERPTSPEAPGFQSKVVDCVMRAGNKEQTVQQVRRLVRVMDDVLKGNQKLTDKDQRALDEARELSERTISNLAVNWHNEAKKTRDDRTFEYANAVYADYLTLFPDNNKAYDLRFFWAELLNDNLGKYDLSAPEYTRVFLQDIGKVEKGQKPGRFFTSAAYNAILAGDEVVRRAKVEGRIKPEPLTDPRARLTMPPEQKALLEACERYLKYIEKGDKRVEISYKAAKIYYDYNYLDEAVKGFSTLALTYPEYKDERGDRLAEIAANLVLDSYNLLAEWDQVLSWAKRFYGDPRLAQGKFKEELAKIIEQASFKVINQLEAKGQFVKAGDAYLTFVTEFPGSELADRALFNAGIDYFKGKSLDRAIEVRRQLLARYARSTYVPLAMYALAEGFEAIADFENAAQYDEEYVNNYEKNRGEAPRRGGKGKAARARDDKDKKKDGQVWDEGKAQDALYNAATFREGLGQYKQALKNRERYLELWPGSKDEEAIEKAIIALLEKTGQWKAALARYEDYQRKWGLKDPSKLLWAEGRLVTLFEEKLKAPKEARRVQLRLLEYHEKLPRKAKEGLDAAAAEAVARADFAQNEDDLRRYQALKLRWTSLNNPGELRASIQSKARALTELQKNYTRTVALRAAGPAICALQRLGLAYDDFTSALMNPPEPKGMTPELLVEVKVQFSQEAQVPRANAAEAFESAVKKSQELDVFNQCTIDALEALRNRYKPEAYPRIREEVPELAAEAFKPTAEGLGLALALEAPAAPAPRVEARATPGPTPAPSPAGGSEPEERP